MDEKEKKFDCGVGEDVTAYGEFVSSYFAWIPLSEQKERAERLDKITKNDEKSRKQIKNEEN